MKPGTVYVQRVSPIQCTLLVKLRRQLTNAHSARSAGAIGTEPSRRVAAFPAFTLVASLNGCSAVGGAPSFELFGAFFPAWLFCGLIGLVASGAARGLFVGAGLSELIPYQLLVCVAIGVTAACLTWLLWFGW
jgi:hypothetical protein